MITEAEARYGRPVRITGPNSFAGTVGRIRHTGDRGCVVRFRSPKWREGRDWAQAWYPWHDLELVTDEEGIYQLALQELMA